MNRRVYRGVDTQRLGLDRTHPGPMTAKVDFETFYDLTREPVRRALALALGNLALADEAIDEAMVRAFAHWETIRGYDRPEGWVYRVGLNWARGVFRKRRFELLTQIETETAAREMRLPEVEVVAAVGRLSKPMRAVVVARYYLDWSTTEVATALEIPEGTVKSRLARALGRLAKELGEDT